MMRILVLRPQVSAPATAERLAALGHVAVSVPLSAPVHDREATLAALANRHSAITITSGEAARVLKSLGAALDPHLRTTVFAVGDATGRAASRAGFRNVLSAARSDGDGLAELIVDHRRQHGVPTDPLLYLAGFPRSSNFEDRLTAAGVAHVTVECYRMEPIWPADDELRPALVDEPVDAVLLYSRESTRRFFELPLVARNLERLERMRFLCISRNVAAVVPAPLSNSVAIAATPDEAGLFDLL